MFNIMERRVSCQTRQCWLVSWLMSVGLLLDTTIALSKPKFYWPGRNITEDALEGNVTLERYCLKVARGLLSRMKAGLPDIMKECLLKTIKIW